MSWRTVVISSRCKLGTRMGYMVVRGGEEKLILSDKGKTLPISKWVEAFLKTVLDHGYRVLLLDCVSREKLSGEKRLTIDNDLCEF